MPVKVQSNLPAIKFLEQENIFVMAEERAVSQEIRPLRIAILNLMPNKIDTETQLLRLIGNTPLQVEVVLVHTASYESKNTSDEHLQSFYKTFDDILAAGEKFDGLVITGAPVEKLDFTEVLYWEELVKIMDWAKHNVYSTYYICWAAQAGVYYHYGINKRIVDKKVFGVFEHDVLERSFPLVRGFDDTFLAPHSRHTEVDCAEIEKCDELVMLAKSKDAGAYLVASKDLRNIFVFGHGEYDSLSLHKEYVRDKSKGMDTSMPVNYYESDDINSTPKLSWRAHTSLLMSNWLNYCVYQYTPYDITKIN